MMDSYFQRDFEMFQKMAQEPPTGLAELSESILTAWENQSTVYSFGNGGSAADSIHFTTELAIKFREAPIQKPAVSLNSNPSVLTAAANDWSFDELFRRQVQTHVRPGDVVIGISTSGNSPNVIQGLNAAIDCQAHVFGLTGSDGGEMSNLDINLITVPSSVTSHIQEAHIACLHWVCDRIDRKLNG